MDEKLKITPMMKQFLELKKEYSDCLLLFRAGDFYETFFDDAKIASKILNITLTKRGETPMAGVPFHSIKPYIKKLIENNFKIAICEQLEDPKKAKGLVKRGITRIITPGTILEDEYIPSFENNYLMCVYIPREKDQLFSVSIVDITTGEFLTTETKTIEEIKTLIKKYSPNEIVFNEKNTLNSLKQFVKNNNIYFNSLSEVRFNYNYSREILKKQFLKTPEQLGLEKKFSSIISSGALLYYIYKLQKLDLSHINKIIFFSAKENMILDSISLRNLEIIESIFSKDKGKTLFSILNKTKTPHGARLLKNHLINPLIEKDKIEDRLNSIEELNNFINERNEIRFLLDEIFDIQRITSRINSEIASPKDLYSLKISLSKIPEIKSIISKFNSKLLKEINKISPLSEIVDLLEKAIVEDAPSHTRDIGYIKKNFDKELYDLFELNLNSKEIIKKIEREEIKKTGISTLRIKFNKVFGYYIEIPSSQSPKIPGNYIQKQTLTNSKRYTIQELKEKEELILNSENKIRELEKKIFENILRKLKKYITIFQNISEKLALLDVLTTHSINSQIYNYSKPTFNEQKTEIIDGRNPIIEQFIDNFISNNTYFDENEKIKIITGPNMSGKSTYLRQNALIILLAQSGSFVPAKKANLKIYDRIFTRIGAHDELSEGQSTFMVEMVETANIINNATKKSFILLDEIGRGTSTYDGLAIAWAIIERIVEIDADTIFATHYHQLNKLTDYFETIKNYNVSVREEKDKIEFLRKIERGGTDKSYGIYVGKLAGIPESVLRRAKEVQENIENKEEIIIKSNFRQSLIKKNKRIEEKRNDNKKLNEFLK